MRNLEQLSNVLIGCNAVFSILTHDRPILSLQDAGRYFDLAKSAPTFVLDNGEQLIALFSASSRGRVDLTATAKLCGFPQLKMAKPQRILEKTGYEAGSIPLIGLEIPCIFDNRLLAFDFIYGGSGDPLHTLKIRPQDVKRLNDIRWVLDD